jgi:branched-subunit amino acid aminotransferase/4-amino-4-deoxychorismate lyase
MLCMYAARKLQRAFRRLRDRQFNTRMQRHMAAMAAAAAAVAKPHDDDDDDEEEAQQTARAAAKATAAAVRTPTRLHARPHAYDIPRPPSASSGC